MSREWKGDLDRSLERIPPNGGYRNTVLHLPRNTLATRPPDIDSIYLASP